MRVSTTARAHGALSICALALTVCATGCNDDVQPQSQPSSVATPSTSGPSPATPTPTSSWQDQYTPQELDAFDVAVARLASYEREAEPIWAAGVVTEEAEAVFREYFPSPVWQGYVDRLATYEEVDVKIVGVPTVLWSMATKISSSDGNSGSVSLRQCVNYQSQTVTQYGEQVERFDTPVLRRATLDGAPDSKWLILALTEPVEGKAKVCSEVEP
jgi:hypothetical protein